MDYVTLVLFLALYYVRPQEWFGALNMLRPVQLLSVLAVVGMVQTGKLKPRELLRTPIDWLVAAYLLWTLICGFQPLKTLGSIEAVMLFYFVAVMSLNSIARMKNFMGWWCVFILWVSFMGVAATWGFDPLNSLQYVYGLMKGRLIVNLSIFNNPNALAHSLVPVIPLIYYLLYWRRVMSKPALLVMILPLYCIFLTQSKGAFLCGFATMLATLTFGRSKVMQIILLVVAIVFGYGALYKLPRMQELSKAKSDAAIQGRVAAFTYGLQLMRTHTFGIGLGNFERLFAEEGPMEKIYTPKMVTSSRRQYKRYVVTERHFSKATHCAYNQNGAELGYVGLYLFVGLMYCSIRTLLLVKCEDDDEERIRRAMFAMVVAYAASSWMVDFCYRPTFFLMLATISAFHRHLLNKEAGAAVPEVVEDPFAKKPWLRRLQPATLAGLGLPGLPAPMPAGAAAGTACMVIEPPAPTVEDAAKGAEPDLEPVEPERRKRPRFSFEEKIRQKFIWTKLGIMDYLIMWALTYAAILYWQHLINTM